MTRSSPTSTPRASSSLFSFSKAAGFTTIPFPMTHRMPGCRIPEGITWTMNFLPPTITVCPALCPPL
jgi:hypothetical protein